jgi:hypothetical protein
MLQLLRPRIGSRKASTVGDRICFSTNLALAFSVVPQWRLAVLPAEWTHSAIVEPVANVISTGEKSVDLEATGLISPAVSRVITVLLLGLISRLRTSRKRILRTSKLYG